MLQMACGWPLIFTHLFWESPTLHIGFLYLQFGLIQLNHVAWFWVPVHWRKDFKTVSMPWWVHILLRHINLFEWSSVCKSKRFFLRGWYKKLWYTYHKTWSSASTQPFNQLTPDMHQSSFLFSVAPERGVHLPSFFFGRGVNFASINESESSHFGNYSQSIWYLYFLSITQDISHI